MSDKSEIEAIRARDAGRKYVTGIVEAQVWQDRRATARATLRRSKRGWRGSRLRLRGKRSHVGDDP